MVLNIKQVNQYLTPYFPTYCIESTPELILKSIVPYHPAASYDDAVLYAGVIDSFPENLPRNFIGIGEVLPPQNWIPRPDINLVILPKTAPFYEVLMLLCSQLMSDNDSRIAAFSSRILNKLSSGDSLEPILEIAYQYLENPIIVSDKNWRVTAMYPDMDIPGDEDWTQFRNNGVLSSEIVTQNMRANLAEILSTSAAPFYWKDERMAFPRLYCNVVAAKQSLATISVLEYNRPISTQDYSYMAILGDALSAELQKKEKLDYSRGFKYEEFIADMIEGTLKSTNLISERIKALNIVLKRYMLLFVIDLENMDSGSLTVTFFRDYLEHIVSDCKAAIYRNYIIIFKTFSHWTDPKELTECAGGEFRSFLKEHNAVCGISNGFEQITDISLAFRQAEEAIALGRRMAAAPPFYFYSDLEIYHVAELLSERVDLLTLCHPKLLELVEYDRRHNTSFSRSLHAWLCNSRNITRTAAALNFHRNSMIYHLKKIEEILGFVLGEADTLLHIELSFCFLEYLNGKFFDNGTKE